VFEPRELFEAGDHVMVLGWKNSKALDTGKPFESEWIHLFKKTSLRADRARSG
jgi:ketosteroid isomerase-like protein